MKCKRTFVRHTRSSMCIFLADLKKVVLNWTLFFWVMSRDCCDIGEPVAMILLLSAMRYLSSPN